MSGDETDSDYDDEFAAHEEIKKYLKKKAMEQKETTGGGRSLRRRSLGQLLTIHKVRENGHCFYLAILKATRSKNLLPGSLFRKRSEKANVDDFRQFILRFMEARAPRVIAQLNAMGTLQQIRDRIAGGCGRNSVGAALWAGDEELNIIREMFNLNIVVLQEEQARRLTAIGNTNIRPGGIILTYTNRNHYDWAEIKNWATLMNNTPSGIQFKF